jgi:hypothetical protein
MAGAHGEQDSFYGNDGDFGKSNQNILTPPNFLGSTLRNWLELSQ